MLFRTSAIIDKISSGDFDRLSEKKQNASKAYRAALKLKDGKAKIASIFKGIFHMATQISSFDLRLSFHSRRIKEATNDLSSMTSAIASASEEMSVSTTQIVNANMELYNAINRISEESNVLAEHTEKSDGLLKSIKLENAEVTNLSEEMRGSVHDLIDVIEKINKTVDGIHAISEQTAMLALNASIEAARVGEAGKGFAVVAGEIRTLSDTTKTMLSNINSLLSESREASKKSTVSVNKTAESIGRVNRDIETVSDMMAKNSASINNIAGSISTVAATSEEVNASLQEMSAALETVNADIQNVSHLAADLDNISNSISEISSSMGDLENGMDSLASAAGRLNNNRLYGMSNDDFITTVEGAVKAHTLWMENLKSMAERMELIPIQTDEHKCGFGHFYYAVKPSSEKLIGPWEEVESLHHDLHKKGEAVIDSIGQGDSDRALQCTNEADEISKVIINEFRKMIGIAKEMSLAGEYVF